MTYQEFKDKYNGKYIDYDRQYGNQCWDLAQQYVTECLGIPEYVLSGCGLVSNLLKEPKLTDMLKYFDEVDEYNLWTGDLVIWEYGHIAIFDNWDGQHCWYFSQNPNPCQVMQINRGGVHGFRLKHNNIDNNTNNDNNTDNTDNIKEYNVTGKLKINDNDIKLDLKINK